MPNQQSQRPVPAARLVLEDGTLFVGRAFGACDEPRTVVGEVVFNTAMSGYQEALTDPSYAGQILAMTATQIGNYGVCPDDEESAGPQVEGFVVRELSRIRSNYRSVAHLGRWLADAGVLGIEGIDTRALVRRLRINGAMRGALSTDSQATDQDLLEAALEATPMAGCNLAADVGPRASFEWREDLAGWSVPGPTVRSTTGPGARATEDEPLRVLALDCGAKRNIYRHLVERGCAVQVVPHDVSPAEIRAIRPDGLFVSNGPGDPAAVKATVETLRAVAGEQPTFGICLGHQLLALALGGRTFKLKFGHRGANQPVHGRLTGRVEITSQNHGFCVDPGAMEEMGCEITHLHLNDGTLAGFRHLTRPIFAVQYHPEASPGPHDAAYLFACFVEMMRTGRPLDASILRDAQVAAATAPHDGAAGSA